MADRFDRKSANLSNSLRDWVGHGEKLIAVFVEKQVIVAKVRAAHVPMEILGFQVEREHVRENGVHGAGYVPGRRTCEIGWCCQRSIASLPKLCSLCRTILTHLIPPFVVTASLGFGCTVHRVKLCEPRLRRGRKFPDAGE